MKPETKAGVSKVWWSPSQVSDKTNNIFVKKIAAARQIKYYRNTGANQYHI